VIRQSFAWAWLALAQAVPAVSADDMREAMEAMVAGNFAEAYCVWRPMALAGDPEAQYHLGWLYANGNGLQVDTRRAVEWWRKAARQGFADAQFAMGLAATIGDGMKRDLNEAVRWYGLAARQGNEDARDILLQLAADPGVQILEQHPEFIDEDWFGWHGRIAGERVNVRGGPGTEHAVIGQLDEDTDVRVIARAGDWLRVVPPAGMTGEQTAWIHSDLVAEDGAAN